MGIAAAMLGGLAGGVDAAVALTGAVGTTGGFTAWQGDLFERYFTRPDGEVVFAAELVYAGTFRMENFPQQMLHPAVLIECPRLIFPFARQILAEATRNGGFPPLMLDPIDFASMYQRRMQQQTAGQA